MTGALPLDFEARSDRIFIHFDVQDHYLKLETFINTAESARRVIEAIDGTFFQGTLKYELIVVPPAEGTFLSKLAIWVGSGTATVFAFLNSDVGAAYIEGLTGRHPTEWAKEIGEAHREEIDELGKKPESSADDAPKLEKSPQSSKISPESDESACKISARIVVAMTRGILEGNTKHLEAIGMEIGQLPEALEARADFYTACIGNPEVMSVGFTPEDDFPIPRNTFPERATKRDRRKTDDESIPWMVSIESIYVTSPNWDQEDQKARNWKGKDRARRDCYFIIEDAEFWNHVQHKDLRVEVLDNLKVQWAFQDVGGRPKNRRVLRVLEFNGDRLADPLSKAAIRSILGEYAEALVPKSQPSLFDD